MSSSAPDGDIARKDSGNATHDELPKTLYTDTVAVVDHAAERSLCFKFDIRILPVLAVMCTSAAHPLVVFSADRQTYLSLLIRAILATLRPITLATVSSSSCFGALLRRASFSSVANE